MLGGEEIYILYVQEFYFMINAIIFSQLKPASFWPLLVNPLVEVLPKLLKLLKMFRLSTYNIKTQCAIQNLLK